MTTHPTSHPTSADVSFPAYVTATTGAAMWGAQYLLGRPLPPELYLWVQLTVPLVMGRLAAAWRVRRIDRRAETQEGPDASASGPS